MFIMSKKKKPKISILFLILQTERWGFHQIILVGISPQQQQYDDVDHYIIVNNY